MNSHAAADEINRTLHATQHDHDNAHFDAWLDAEEQRRGAPFKDAETYMRQAWHAALAHERAAWTLPLPQAAAKPRRQYFYGNPACRADSKESPDCICWHNEGSGPLSLKQQTALVPYWIRDAPAQN